MDILSRRGKILMPPCKFSDCKETYYVNTFRCVVMVRHWYFRGTRVYQPRNLFVLWISVQEIRWVGDVNSASKKKKGRVRMYLPVLKNIYTKRTLIDSPSLSCRKLLLYLNGKVLSEKKKIATGGGNPLLSERRMFMKSLFQKFSGRVGNEPI